MKYGENPGAPRARDFRQNDDTDTATPRMGDKYQGAPLAHTEEITSDPQRQAVVLPAGAKMFDPIVAVNTRVARFASWFTVTPWDKMVRGVLSGLRHEELNAVATTDPLQEMEPSSVRRGNSFRISPAPWDEDIYV